MKRAIFCIFVSVFALSAQERSLLTNTLDLPNWLTINAQARERIEGQHGVGYVDDNDQNFMLHRYRFGVGVTPTGWLRFYGEAQDARVSGDTTDSTTRDRIDLRQAYVDIGHENAWWDVKAGRQVLAFGSERMVGGSDWTNVARVFDGAKLGIHHGADRVDIFASSVVVVDPLHQDHHLEGGNLHGIYGSFGSLVKNAKIEPYLMMRTGPTFAGELGALGKYNSYTYGLRTAGAYRKVWLWETDILGQHGTIGSSDLRAWGAEVQGKRVFTNVKWTPTILGEFNFATGDKNIGDGKVNTLDQLYPTNHGIYGVADQMGRRNTKNTRAGFWLQPTKWLTLKGEEEEFWLASKFDGLYLAGGGIGVAAVQTGAISTKVGREADVLADIKLSKYYTIGMQYGHLFTGQFLDTYAHGVGRTFYAAWIDFRL